MHWRFQGGSSFGREESGACIVAQRSQQSPWGLKFLLDVLGKNPGWLLKSGELCRW
jgi:hypothetical protein